MRRLGVIGRADMGGIAQQSLAVARHLEPYVSAALVLDMSPGDRGRGPFDPTPWTDALGDRVTCASFPFSDYMLDWLIGQSDVIFAVEGPMPGRNDFADRCAAAGVELVFHVNPELWQEVYRGPTTRLTLPTTWHQERFPDATLLPMPVDRERFPYTHRDQARTFLHVSAPAFHDRAGTALLHEALPFVESPVRFIMHGVRDTGPVKDTIGRVNVEYRVPVADHRDVYPRDADVLVVPRRYGGLSLNAAESASLGLPLVTLDLPPLNARPGVLTVPLTTSYDVAMIGGTEPVWTANPHALAREIDLLARHPRGVQELSRQADQWAAENSWSALLPTWVEVLGL